MSDVLKKGGSPDDSSPELLVSFWSYAPGRGENCGGGTKPLDAQFNEWMKGHPGVRICKRQLTIGVSPAGGIAQAMAIFYREPPKTGEEVHPKIEPEFGADEPELTLQFQERWQDLMQKVGRWYFTILLRRAKGVISEAARRSGLGSQRINQEINGLDLFAEDFRVKRGR